MTVYILGAGPAGMAVVDGLVDANAGNFVVLDKAPVLGGLAQTSKWEGVGDHDLGPHKIFSLDQTLVARVEGLLEPERWLTRNKVSSIYMRGHFLPYPPSPFSLAGVFGVAAFARMVSGYGFAKLKSLFFAGSPKTFEEDLQGRLGKPLYQILFKPIAEKLWGDPKELDVKLSKGRVQTPSLSEVLGRLLKLKSDSKFEALTFRYPKAGLGSLWHSIERKSKGHGKFLLNHVVAGITVENKTVKSITVREMDGKESVFDLAPEDLVVSTLPLMLTADLLGESLSPNIKAIAQQVVTLNDLLLVFLHVDTSSLLDESWVFVPDPDIAFHRLSEQESFDPEMTQNGSIVCCEIMSSSKRPMAEKNDTELVSLAENGLVAMGYDGFRVLNHRVIRLPKSYPVFREGFEPGLKKLIGELDELKNFKSIGRQGAFNYIGTLDAMDIGYGYAKWISDGMKTPWEGERERTNHYPVLD